MERAHLVDFVLEAMKNISVADPILFQRDGALFVASKEGFGYVYPGLRTRAEDIQEWEKREQPREIRESSVTMKYVKRGEKNVCQFTEGERERVAPISFGPDSTLFTLKAVSEAVEKLAKLKDDRKIRMVLHDSGYHSHKYGYACDGMDVWLNSARVMDRSAYLEIMRQNHDRLLEGLEELGTIKDDHDKHRCYEKALIPRAIILTRNLMVTLPRDDRIVYDREKVSCWSDETELKQDHQGGLPSTYTESPYAVRVKVNSVYERCEAAAEYKGARARVIGNIDRELQALEDPMKIAEEFIERMNGIHNKIGAKNIQWSKDLRKTVHK